MVEFWESETPARILNTVTPKGMQSVWKFFIQRCADLCVSAWAEKVVALFMACKSTSRGISQNLKNARILRPSRYCHFV
jgi:hypothetical protein